MKIQEDNFRELLTKSLGFTRKTDEVHDILYKYYEDINAELSVYFTEEKLNYPPGLEANRDTTKNFSQAENAVVFECVASLFDKGYKPELIILEKGMPGGHGDTGGYCDIIVQDNNKKPYLLVECKTRTGEKNDEFSKAWKRMQNDLAVSYSIIIIVSDKRNIFVYMPQTSQMMNYRCEPSKGQPFRVCQCLILH